MSELKTLTPPPALVGELPTWRERFESRGFDARWNLPRPINEQHLLSYQAFLRLLQDAGWLLAYCAAWLFSGFLWWHMYQRLSLVGAVPALFWLVAGGALGLTALAVYIDFERLKFPYRLTAQRQTHGSSRWATAQDLRRAKYLISMKSQVLPRGMMPLAPFRRNLALALPMPDLAEHFAVIGKPGTGKTSTFFMAIARYQSFMGSILALDIKGEIYQYTAHYYDNVFRVDLKNPACSDWFDILGECKRDPVRAAQIAYYIIGFDPNTKGNAENEFWPRASALLLKCLFLHLCEIRRPQDPPVAPGDVFDFLARYPTKYECLINGKPGHVNLLAQEMRQSPSEAARVEFAAAFSNLNDETMGNVVGSMLSRLEQFRNPKVVDVTRPPSPDEAARGRRRVDFKDLRKTGTAIYFVVPEGEAAQFDIVMRTFFAMALDTLRVTGDAPEACYCIMLLDEAGNVKLFNLKEGVGVGRGRKIIYGLGWQNINQPQDQYGRDYARATLEAISTKIFLPGCEGETAKYASDLCGHTTVLERSSRDAVANKLDSENLSERTRALIQPDEFALLKPRVQAVARIKGLPPIRLAFPAHAPSVDPRKSVPPVYIEAKALASIPAQWLTAQGNANTRPDAAVASPSIPPPVLSPSASVSPNAADAANMNSSVTETEAAESLNQPHSNPAEDYQYSLAFDPNHEGGA